MTFQFCNVTVIENETCTVPLSLKVTHTIDIINISGTNTFSDLNTQIIQLKAPPSDILDILAAQEGIRIDLHLSYDRKNCDSGETVESAQCRHIMRSFEAVSACMRLINRKPTVTSLYFQNMKDLGIEKPPYFIETNGSVYSMSLFFYSITCF